MTYGLRVWDATGKLTFDSIAHVGGMVIDIISVAPGSADSYKLYTAPGLNSREIRLVQNMWGIYAFTVSYDVSGTPKVSWTKAPVQPGVWVPVTSRCLVIAR